MTEEAAAVAETAELAAAVETEAKGAAAAAVGEWVAGRVALAD
jgi:hypothetical protein